MHECTKLPFLLTLENRVRRAMNDYTLKGNLRSELSIVYHYVLIVLFPIFFFAVKKTERRTLPANIM